MQVGNLFRANNPPRKSQHTPARPASRGPAARQRGASHRSRPWAQTAARSRPRGAPRAWAPAGIAAAAVRRRGMGGSPAAAAVVWWWRWWCGWIGRWVDHSIDRSVGRSVCLGWARRGVQVARLPMGTVVAAAVLLDVVAAAAAAAGPGPARIRGTETSRAGRVGSACACLV